MMIVKGRSGQFYQAMKYFNVVARFHPIICIFHSRTTQNGAGEEMKKTIMLSN